MNLLVRLFITTLAVLGTTYLLPGVHVDNFWTALVVAIVLGLLNTFLKPILILISIPVILLTLGLFLLVINTIVILIADKLIDGFEVDGFWWALLFSLVMWVVSSFLNHLKEKRMDKQH